MDSWKNMRGLENIGQWSQGQMPSIPYGRQTISEADIAAVVEVLRSDWVTQGPAVPAFEAAVAERCDARHAVAVNSATSALHLACLALDIGPGDLVWTVPNTFVASANCVLYCGAEVDFVDIDPDTFCMSVDALATKLAHYRALGRQLPKALIPVHFAGQSCDMAAIADLAIDYGFRVIEDASHAIGGTYQDRPIGNCRYSDITIFSFHPVKIITTGEGGMALTNDPQLDRRMQRLRSHGITREPSEMSRDDAPAWHYEQQALGFNYRMTDIQAALGLSQLQRLHECVGQRRELAVRYDSTLSHLGVKTQMVPAWTASARHLYVIHVPAAIRDGMLTELRRCGIQATLHYPAVHLQPFYRRFGFAPGDFPMAERHGHQAISLPLYPQLRMDEQDHVIRTLTCLLTAEVAEAAS
jgi:UDP-4-amino-4,6-dideoxy-N-acetyl-beta-L-altrosamine transaminase